MGNGTSNGRVLSQQEQDVQYLGERYPFGDDELLRLRACFYALSKCPNRISFLTDWAVHSSLYAKEWVQAVEEFILPRDFGRVLEQKAFLHARHVGLAQECGNEKKNSTEKDGLYVAQSSSLAIQQSQRPCCCCFPIQKISQNEKMQLLQQQQQQSCIVEATGDHHQENMERLEAFLEGSANCGRRGGRAALKVLFECCSSEQQEADPLELLEWGYRIALASLVLTTGADVKLCVPESTQNEALQALSNSLLQYSKKYRERDFTSCSNNTSSSLAVVSLPAFLEWSESTAPLLASSLGTFMHAILFADKPHPPSRTALAFPRIDSESSFFKSPSSPMLFSFSCMSSSLGGAWHRLYTSESDGLSFNRLQLSLLGYGGPTLLVIRSTSGGIFGAFTASAWKETRDFYGNSDCFLFQLLPETRVYRPTGSGKNFMYCNSEARSKGFDGLAHGIGFGGTTQQPRLFIDESFDECVASSSDLTFDRGPLLQQSDDGDFMGSNKKRFDIDTLEVWGVGGDEVVEQALGARMKQREITAANIRKARKVDKAAFLEDFQTGIIESKAFQHRDQIRGRADACVDDKHQNGYVYEK